MMARWSWFSRLYRPSLSTIGICRRYLPSLSTFGICRHLPSLSSVVIYIRYLPLSTFGICHYVHSISAVYICSVCVRLLSSHKSPDVLSIACQQWWLAVCGQGGERPRSDKAKIQMVSPHLPWRASSVAIRRCNWQGPFSSNGPRTPYWGVGRRRPMASRLHRGPEVPGSPDHE